MKHLVEIKIKNNKLYGRFENEKRFYRIYKTRLNLFDDMYIINHYYIQHFGTEIQNYDFIQNELEKLLV